MISAQIDTAVSSGVRPPMSSPIGARIRAEPLVGHTRLAEPLDTLARGCAAIPSRRGTHIRRQRADDRGHVELGVVGEHTDRIAHTELVADLLEVPVGPIVHDLVGHREPLRASRTPPTRRRR